MTNFHLEIPATEYLLNADRYHLSIHVTDDDETPATMWTGDEYDAVVSGDAHPVTVTFRLYRSVQDRKGKRRILVSREDEPEQLYGFVNGEPVSPVPHPQCPLVMSQAMDMILDALDMEKELA